jgi:hypothetical protein
LIDGWRTGVVDYDRRARGTSIETHLAAADAELGRLIASVERLAKLDADDSIGVSVMPKRTSPIPSAPTTRKPGDGSGLLGSNSLRSPPALDGTRNVAL